MTKNTINNSPDSEKSDHSKSWFSEIVEFFEAIADTNKTPLDKASATLVGAGTQPTDKTTKPSVLVTRTAPDSPLVDIKTIKEDDPSMPAAPSPRSTSSDDSARGSTRSRSPDSAAGVFGGQQNPYLGSRPSSPANQVSIHPQPLISSAPCRTHNEIPKTPTFIDGLPDVFSALGALFQVNPDTSPDTSTKPPRVKNSGRTGSTAPSSSRRSNSSTSEITAAAPSAPPTPAAAPSVFSTENEKVNKKTGCLPKPKFLAKLLSKFSLSKSKNTDKESVVSTTARSATPSRPASATARSATPSRPGSATARSATPSRPGSATPSRAGSPSRPASITATPSRAGSPSRPASITATPSRAGSPSRPAKKSLKERIQELWHKLKLHKSADGRGDGRKEEATGSYAIFLDTARWFKKIPNKVSTSSQKLLSEFFDRCSRAATTISSFKIPKLPERPVVNQQPLTFTRNTSPRSSVSKTFSDGVRAFKERYSEVMENMRNSTDTSYTPSQQNQTTSFSRKASGLFKRIQGAYIDYQEHQAYNSHRSSHTSSGPTLSFPTPPTSQDIQNAANKFNSGAFWGAKFLKERTIYAADSAYSSAASRASQVKRYAKNLYDWKDRYTAPDVHALWWGQR